jgi:hypothetical protein
MAHDAAYRLDHSRRGRENGDDGAWVRRITAAILLLSSLMSSRAAAQTEPSTGPRPSLTEAFNAGETLTFSLAWVRVIGGTAQMTIGPVVGQPTYRMTSLMQSNSVFSLIFKVRDEVESVVDRQAFSTIRYQKLLNERGKMKNELTVVDAERHVALRKGTEIPVPHPVFDPLSLMYHLRTLELTPGMTARFSVIADGKVYVMEAAVTRREAIQTEAGRFDTVVVEPKLQEGGIFRDERNRLILWYSDDARHLPVRIRSEFKAGTITATLRSVQIGPVAVPAAPQESARPGKR